MRKLTAGFLALTLLAHGCLALAAGLPMAAPIGAHRSFERNQSYKLLESGEWSAHDLSAAQMLRTISSGAARSYMGTGLCVLYPRVRGNIALGLTEVVLNVCLIKTAPLGADSLSILTEGARYDFVAPSKKETIGAFACETFELPMDARGIAMLREIEAGGCSVSIYGGTKQYRTTIQENAVNQTAKQKLEAVSIGGIRNLLAEYDQVGLLEYALWDLNAGQWSTSRPQMSVVYRSSEPPSNDVPKTDELFECLAIADRTAVTQMQQLLKDNAFYAGKVDGRYGADTRASIREAQRYYGLTQTGQADRALIGRLSGTQSMIAVNGETPKAQVIEPNGLVDAQPGVGYRCESVAEVRLDRRWFAQKLLPTLAAAQPSVQTAQPTRNASPSPTPTRSPADIATIEPQNASNLLLAIDGELTNLGTASIFLPMSTQAQILINGLYAYPCTVRCEQDQGQAWGTALLPLERRRLVLYAEVPEDVIDAMSIELTFTIQNGDMALTLRYQ